MRGHAPRPSTTYVNQLSQPPLYAKVDQRASDSDIIFERSRSILPIDHPKAIVFETKRMQDIHKRCSIDLPVTSPNEINEGTGCVV